MKNRAELKGEFADHECPTGADYANIFDSTINLTDDGVEVGSPLFIKSKITEGEIVLGLKPSTKERGLMSWGIALANKEGQPGLKFFNELDTSSLFISSDQKVGILTEFPKTSLHINGDLKVESRIYGGGHLTSLNKGLTLLSQSEIIDSPEDFGKGAYIILKPNDCLIPQQRGSLYLGYGDRSGNIPGSASIRFQKTENGKSEDVMIIDKEGRVGIGTNSPQRTLEVNGTIKTRDVYLHSWSRLSYLSGKVLDVSISKKTMMVICKQESGITALQVFEKTGINWRLEKFYEKEGLKKVNLDRNRAVVGFDYGVYVLQKDDGNWVGLQNPIILCEEDGDMLVKAVVRDSSIIIVGINGYPNSDKPGKVLQLNSQGAIRKTYSGNTSSFGCSVDSDYGKMIIGAPESVNGYGEVYLYKWDDSQQFIRFGDAINGKKQANDKFGFDVRLYFNKFIIGSPGQDNGLGSVYIGEVEDSGLERMVELEFPDSTLNYSGRGQSVAIFGSDAIVGASGNPQEGAALFFKETNQDYFIWNYQGRSTSGKGQGAKVEMYNDYSVDVGSYGDLVNASIYYNFYSLKGLLRELAS